MNAPERQESLRWLKFSFEDLSVAKAIFSDKHLPARLVCFHCQQSVEKALKALLVFRCIRFPKTHDLNLLLQLLPSDSPLAISSMDLSSLNVYATEARYPGDFPDAGTEEARQAIQVAERILADLKTSFSE